MSDRPLYLQAIDALKRREKLLRVFLFTLVTVFFWIGFSIYFAQSQSKLDINIKKHTQPLNPNIDNQLLIELSSRRKYTNQELVDFPIYERVLDENGVSQLILVGTGIPPVQESLDGELVNPETSEEVGVDEDIVEPTDATGETELEEDIFVPDEFSP